jgi:hypothetical protein
MRRRLPALKPQQVVRALNRAGFTVEVEKKVSSRQGCQEPCVADAHNLWVLEVRLELFFRAHRLALHISAMLPFSATPIF